MFQLKASLAKFSGFSYGKPH